MTVTEAIEQLTKIAAKHGSVEVYFDCPECGKSFTPNAVVTAAVHLGGTKPMSEIARGFRRG